MRLNQFIARSTGCSRREADRLIEQGTVTINGILASVGQQVAATDTVALKGHSLNVTGSRTIMLHKPVGYVVSRDGQGSRTIYELLPPELDELKAVGRLDKYSSGLLLMTNDGEFANRLTHPRYKKLKLYHITLDRPLELADKQAAQAGVELDDGLSHLKIHRYVGTTVEVIMEEGRKRQIRRTFAALGYTVKTLHRTQFGPYHLGDLPAGEWQEVQEHSSA